MREPRSEQIEKELTESRKISGNFIERNYGSGYIEEESKDYEWGKNANVRLSIEPKQNVIIPNMNNQ